MRKIVVDPLTRIEGHLKIEAIVDGGVVKEARSTGTLFRGIELILEGRDPRDANRITQRICGVCPTSHATASSQCVDNAFGIDGSIPDNGRIMRNLILGSNYIQSHVLHFYHLAALDYVDVAQAAGYEGNNADLKSVRAFIDRGQLGPFMPRYEGDYRLPKEANNAAVAHYVEAFRARRKAHEMLAIFGGRGPHNCATVAGGVTEQPTVDKITRFLWRLNEIREFIDNVYIPDVLAVAKAYTDYFEIGGGCNNYLSYGVLDLLGTDTEPAKRTRFLPQGTVSAELAPADVDAAMIREDVRHSWYDDSSDGLHPSEGQTVPAPGKKDGYSWLKSPRYDGRVYEVGPLARALVAYARGHDKVKPLIDSVLAEFNAAPSALFSVLGRHAARALETKVVADAMADWVLELKPGEPVMAEYDIPDEGSGFGMLGAPRGALGHWLEIKDKVIERYQCVVPTTWNGSPRDAQNQPGPIEQALEGTPIKDEDNPFEIVRIVRSFDPCLACSVHAMTPKNRVIAKYQIL